MTSVSDALAGVTKLGFDTAPLIYFVERDPARLAVVREIVRAMDQGQFQGYASTLTLTEVLTQPLKVGNTLIASKYRALLEHGRNFNLIPIDTTVAVSAAEMRAKYGLKTPDAIQVAAAIHAGCEAMLTNDARLRRVTELTILVVDELQV